MNDIDYDRLSTAELNAIHAQLLEAYEAYKRQKLSLDMSRGKPCDEQLDLSLEMLDIVGSGDVLTDRSGLDSRNYGGLDGIPEAKDLFAQLLDVSPSELIIGGASSLTMMHDTLSRAMLHGVFGSSLPWGKLPAVKFICPSPGYDRHFAICELLGIEMIAIDMLQDGPDMDQVEKLAAGDDAVKGIWCVPKYSNPDGITYSDEVVDRLARMETCAGDFRIMWDDAYTVHHLADEPDRLKPMLAACKAAGHPDRVLMFSSTSKISFPGAGVAVMAGSENNMNFIRKQLAVQTIGPDKLNQLRHVRFFKGPAHIEAHMKKHAAIIKPKFEMVLNLLETELGGKRIASWNKPNGGYFISLNIMDGCARSVVRMAAEAGVTLTKAGATFPYGHDPRDRNIRIAPTFPTLSELKTAIEILCLCVQIMSIRTFLNRRGANGAETYV
ncbi:aminotransferase class I/II-fold pyridoxal phosphate-dependent enzyme [Paenibacillus piri]|uniref:Aminotransferase class I/II-fold pyridoxal phosphate-dependent enzyme n=1 Tax=Paenibacillus piri TaxID=2547395 RepID=A0A4R5K7Y0_9BACL|nr:aminotransferase class I/II-fold pyridoxal phosphate-dependent enzyme [Paenibacillus piri]TDF91223.1 aminotransferase class I/II-fold pyridoxal phosphate-dependent enzyme [Paenibacillus piri]